MALARRSMIETARGQLVRVERRAFAAAHAAPKVQSPDRTMAAKLYEQASRIRGLRPEHAERFYERRSEIAFAIETVADALDR